MHIASQQLSLAEVNAFFLVFSHEEYWTDIKTIKIEYQRQEPLECSQIFSPWLRGKVDSGIGVVVSVHQNTVCSRAGQYDTL